MSRRNLKLPNLNFFGCDFRIFQKGGCEKTRITLRRREFLDYHSKYNNMLWEWTGVLWLGRFKCPVMRSIQAARREIHTTYTRQSIRKKKTKVKSITIYISIELHDGILGYYDNCIRPICTLLRFPADNFSYYFFNGSLSRKSNLNRTMVEWNTLEIDTHRQILSI